MASPARAFDRIAANAGANKRMLYYHVGNKEDLYLAVLEGAYEKIRSEERELDLEHLDPPEAIERLIDFTWNYFLRNPEFLALLNTENLAKARHLKRSTKVKSMHSPFVEMIRTVVTRGVESGDFRVAVDPVQLYISIAALCFFYLSNSATLSVIFGRDLLKKDARDQRLAHMVALVLAALTGKSTADFGKPALPGVRSPRISRSSPSFPRTQELICRGARSFETVVVDPAKQLARWLWVPAFAGTTAVVQIDARKPACQYLSNGLISPEKRRSSGSGTWPSQSARVACRKR
jgi:AcrR family transcriptional regulator